MTGAGRQGLPPIRVEKIAGNRVDPALHDKLHDLSHAGGLDVAQLPSADLPRRRLQLRTQAGRLLQISLPREESLADGAVLWLDDTLAIVLRVAEQRLLRLTPRNKADALGLGYCAGNLHWAVRFDGDTLVVPLEGRAEDYIARLGPLAELGRLDIQVVDQEARC